MPNRDEREAIFHYQRPLIELAFLASCDKGVDRPIVFVLDLRDDGAREWATGTAGAETVQRLMDDGRAKDAYPCCLNVLPHDDARAIIEKMDVSLLPRVDAFPFPDNTFRALVVYRGFTFFVATLGGGKSNGEGTAASA